MQDTTSHLFEESPAAIANRLLQKVHNRDGFPEIAIGLLLLVFAGLIYVQAILPRRSASFIAVTVALAIVFPMLGFGVPRAVRWVRRRFLIQRVGYVQPKPIGRKQIVTGILLNVGILVVLFGVVPQLSQPDRWLLAGSGLFFGAIAALGGRTLRFVLGGILVAAAGILIAFSGASLENGFAMLWGFVGLLSLLSGCIVFLLFIRQSVEPGE